MFARECTHQSDLIDVHPGEEAVCEECAVTGDRYISLRVCLTCGHVGCCDSSKNKHATRHFETTGHPVARSLTKGGEFRWCYVDKVYF